MNFIKDLLAPRRSGVFFAAVIVVWALMELWVCAYPRPQSEADAVAQMRVSPWEGIQPSFINIWGN